MPAKTITPSDRASKEATLIELIERNARTLAEIDRHLADLEARQADLEQRAAPTLAAIDVLTSTILGVQL